jgi:peptidoglycan/xylan/chitin deacetylase (PgdA/CDA1 family)
MGPWIPVAGAMAGAAALAGYHTLAWRSQLYGATFFGTPGHGKRLALTYDDGPNDPHTLHLLDVLARYDVKATFFLIGRFVRSRPDIVRRIIAAGHAIGNHTYSHPNLLFCSEKRLRHELYNCEKMLADAGMPPGTNGDRKLFRPPFGARRPMTLLVARAMGYLPVMWSVAGFDWKKTTAERVERHVTRSVRGGDVILLHDGGHRALGTDRAHTVRATEHLLRRYQPEGFEFVSVTEWLRRP